MNTELLKCRDEIDRIDDQIVQLIEQRMAVSSRVGTLKRTLGLPTQDTVRERAVIERLCAGGGFMQRYIPRLYATIFQLSREHQQRHAEDR